MPRWRFLLVRHFGGPQQRRLICAKIKLQVEQHGLSHVLPLVKYELGRQREYYLGVAIDADAAVNGEGGEDTARRVLTEAGVHAAANRQLSPMVEADQVQGLLRGTLECESFTSPIAYESQAETAAPRMDELMAEFDAGDLTIVSPDADDAEKFERLLHWCSAIGSGDLGRIRYACELLGIADEWGGAWSVLRRLVLLGHAEFNSERSLRWGIIPPALVTTADGASQVLVGQRTPVLLEAIRQAHAVETVVQAGGPACLRVPAGVDATEYRPGYRVTSAGNMSEWLSNRLPVLGVWASCLPVWEERDFARFKTEQYNPETNDFRQIDAIVGMPPSGLYRFTFDQGQQRVVTLVFRDATRDQWVCGDYYGLRFLARSRCQMSRAVYQPDAQRLLVPTTDRWPMPYERALVLANGTLPQRVRLETGAAVLAYAGITPQLASALGARLRVGIEGA